MNKSPLATVICHRTKPLMAKLGSQCPKQKSSVDFGDSERTLEGGGGQGGSRDVEWDRLPQYHQSAMVSPILIKVGVPYTAEASHVYSGAPLDTLTFWPSSPGPSIH